MGRKESNQTNKSTGPPGRCWNSNLTGDVLTILRDLADVNVPQEACSIAIIAYNNFVTWKLLKNVSESSLMF